MTVPDREDIQRAHYCLYCYGPLESKPGPSQRCERCGRVHVQVDHAVYWTLEPRMRWIERVVKASIVVSILGLPLVLVKWSGGFDNLTGTFLCGPFLLLGPALWWTAGLITRQPRHFSPRVLWTTVVLLFAVAPPILIFIIDVAARHESFGPDYWRALPLMAVPATPAILVAAGLQLFGRSFEAFKRRRIASGGS